MSELIMRTKKGLSGLKVFQFNPGLLMVKDIPARIKDFYISKEKDIIKMSKKALLTAMMFIFALTSACYAAGPKIKLVSEDVDIGEVKKGEVFNYRIEVRNVGVEDLVIENVYSTCGCLEVTDKRWLIAPDAPKPNPVVITTNNSIYIATRLDTNKVSGEFEKMLHIVSNDSENKDVAWKVRGNVLAAQGAAATPDNVVAPSNGANAAAKIIMVFYSPGCKECSEIMEKFLPEIKNKYSDKILIVDYNIDNMESYEFLLELENKFDERSRQGFFNPKPPIVVIENRLLYGAKEIEKGLEELIK